LARLFALGDLHLSLTGLKPMDAFGELWRDHPRRMAEHWDARVSEEDTVLLAGDLSWARNAEEAAPDLAWIEARPGRKLLLRGNHDSWWGGAKKLRAILPPSCEPLSVSAHRVPGWVVVGARGWTAPGDPWEEPGDEKIFRRELERLKLSIRAADREFGREEPRLALLHYPPWIDPQRPTAVVGLLRSAGVRSCVYGHLHGDDHRRAVTGERDGVRYRFVAADAVDFGPVEIDPPDGEAP
jgi:predicted phosphohydrolase